MWNGVFAVSTFGVLVSYLLQYRDWLDLNKRFIHRVVPGPCQIVIDGGGSEDVTYVGDNIVLISSGLGAGVGKGVIKALDLGTKTAVTMKIRGKPDRKDFMTDPHGISTWKNEKGQIYVYVLTHPSSEDKVEVFKLKGNGELKYKRTITDPNFTYMNDLVVVGRDQFYITRFWFYRDRTRRILEYMAWNSWGGVLYFDGKKARDIVPSGLLMPNGINISPDGKMIYVAEFGRKILHGFHRTKDNLLSKTWEFPADTLVDNIEVDPSTGDLWIGCHPVAYRIFDDINQFFGLSLPSQVLRFKIRDNMVSEVEEIYADDGSQLFGSTAATYVNGTLVIGTIRDNMVSEVEEIYADDGSELFGSTAATYVNGTLVIGTVNAETLVCNVNYLSP